MNKVRIKLFALIIGSLIFPVLIATAQTPQTINVPADAPTIQAAIDLANDGDLVLVAPGLYQENIQLVGKTITLASHFYTSQDPSFIEQTIIDGGGGSNRVINVDAVGPATQIIGFTIQNGDDGIYASAKLQILNNRLIGHKDAIDYEGNSGGLLRDNVFENNTDDAIDLDSSIEVTIEDNVILNNNDDGIEIRLQEHVSPTLTIIIRNNTITGSGEDGIQIIGYPEVSNRVFFIEHNLIADSAMVGLGMMDNAETREDFRGASIPDRIHLFNNTFVNNDHAITGGDNLIALNNLIVGSSTLGLKNVDGDSIAAHNLFWENGTDAQNSNVDAATTFVTDPLLDTDYSLLPGSPAIDAGTASSIWNGETVLDLQPEDYEGTAPDLGASETQSEHKFYLPIILHN